MYAKVEKHTWVSAMPKASNPQRCQVWKIEIFGGVEGRRVGEAEEHMGDRS